MRAAVLSLVCIAAFAAILLGHVLVTALKAAGL